MDVIVLRTFNVIRMLVNAAWYRMSLYQGDFVKQHFGLNLVFSIATPSNFTRAWARFSFSGEWRRVYAPQTEALPLAPVKPRDLKKPLIVFYHTCSFRSPLSIGWALAKPPRYGKYLVDLENDVSGMWGS